MLTASRKTLTSGTLYWLGLPLLVTLAGLLPGNYISHSSLLMLYLIAVLFCSLRTDQWGVMACALFSFGLFNYFHTAPRFSLWMHEPDEFISALTFIGFALLAGGVSYQLKSQLHTLRTQSHFLELQVALGQHLQGVEQETDILPLLSKIRHEVFQDKVAFSLRPAEDEAADGAWCLDWVAARTLDADRQAMLTSLREQVHSALSRLAVAKALKRAQRKSDEERLRTSLLSSVSHDLKTPLVTMMGAATSLRDLHQDLSEADTRALLDSIIEESRRLDSYIQNLLDMTRLGHGHLSLSREWVSIDEVHYMAVKRIARQWPDHQLRFEADPGLPSLHVHAALIEQALFNALDNALKAAGAQSDIQVRVTRNGDFLHIDVCDRGPGLPHDQWEGVFAQFHTFSRGDCYEKGTGLGLSICRSILRVHGGDARIVPPPAGFHHCLRLALPAPTINEETEGS